MSATIGSGYLARALDRPGVRPHGMAYWLDEAPANAVTLGLALQHVAIQSVYFVIPAVVAGSLSPDPADATRFLALSILAAALWQALQLLGRGPLGSGYPIPGTHTAALVGAYSLVGLGGGGFGAAGASLALAGLAAVGLTFVMRRLRVVLPNEVAGVVVILIGVALVLVATQRLGLQPGGTLPGLEGVGAVFGSLALMVGVALRTCERIPPFDRYMSHECANDGTGG